MNTALLHKRISTLERTTAHSDEAEGRRQASLILDQLEILEKQYPDITNKFIKIYETKFVELCSNGPEKSFDDFTPERIRELILQACGVK